MYENGWPDCVRLPSRDRERKAGADALQRGIVFTAFGLLFVPLRLGSCTLVRMLPVFLSLWDGLLSAKNCS